MPKKKAEKPKREYGSKIVWRIRKVSEDGLLKIPGGEGWASEKFNEWDGYPSVEAAMEDVMSDFRARQKVSKYAGPDSDLVAIPFLEVDEVFEEI